MISRAAIKSSHGPSAFLVSSYKVPSPSAIFLIVAGTAKKQKPHFFLNIFSLKKILCFDLRFWILCGWVRTWFIFQWSTGFIPWKIILEKQVATWWTSLEEHICGKSSNNLFSSPRFDLFSYFMVTFCKSSTWAQM